MISAELCVIFTKFLRLQYLCLKLLQEYQPTLNQRRHPLHQQPIPQQPHHKKRHSRRKQTHKPLNRKYGRIQPHLIKLLAYPRQMLPDTLRQYPLIADHPNHIRVVVHGDDALDHLGQEPEALLLGELHGEDEMGDEV